MTLTLLKPVKPTSLFAAVFTQNAFPGAPVLVGRKRLQEPKLGAILINNKISNVCASGGGVADAEEVCESLAKHLRLDAGTQVLPCSTGVIGWRIPVDAMVANLPKLVKKLQSDSVLPAAEGIMTTDLYPKVRSMDVCGGRIVGIAKGAGMIEPNMATMLSYILTDLSIPRDVLRQLLKEVVGDTYNSLSIDTDQSTSDTVALVSSDMIPFDMKHLDEVKKALYEVCLGLSEDVVRNGEGAHHVIRVSVGGALTKEMAKGVGKSVVNSPLLKCAVAGNDPNVGRLVMAVGKYMGLHFKDVNIQRRMKVRMGGVLIFENGEMVLNDDIEAKLVAHMRDAMLIEPTRGGLDASSHNYPPHGKFVEVLGIDLTHEYVAINADYRS
uniref:Arginine biosynthesis bifunctional protein ArgJ, mitochondrial n=1 Tax=Hyaloperonospora arabidopsidis (strain Emoy2) TaxID=559515 RepID=M4BAP7_HYAAE